MAFEGRRAKGAQPRQKEALGDRSPPVRHPLPSDADMATPALSGEVYEPSSPSSLGADIPPHVWALLQQAGETAATRLVQVLQSPRFTSYAPSAQRGLIELALTRAYGLPIRKALNLNLSTSDSDAVAASLADLAANLPENAQTRVKEALSRVFPEDPSQKSDTP
jgi:hypothetical protein